MVADILSYKTVDLSAGTIYYEKKNLVTLWTLNINLDVGEDYLLATLQVQLTLVDQIGKAQMEDAYLKRMREKVGMGANT